MPSAGFGGRKLKAEVNAGHRRLFLIQPSRTPTCSVALFTDDFVVLRDDGKSFELRISLSGMMKVWLYRATLQLRVVPPERQSKRLDFEQSRSHHTQE